MDITDIKTGYNSLLTDAYIDMFLERVTFDARYTITQSVGEAVTVHNYTGNCRTRCKWKSRKIIINIHTDPPDPG